MKPCKGCPFSPDTRPGNLGGSGPEVYLGQAVGPFALPCHSASGYVQDVETAFRGRPCAGVAIFRANIGVADLMPPAIHREAADPELAFPTPEAFLAHHCETTVPIAKRILEEIPLTAMLAMQLSRPTTVVKSVPAT